jgi:hypothetical protein
MLALVLAASFVLFQAWTADYGTRINALPYIQNYEVPASALSDSAVDRPLVIGSAPAETRDRWMVRFKFYSVDADEMLNVMALARINPAKGQFDPHYYQYGGAWLYPLGAWYALISKLGLIHIEGGLTALAAHPDRMDDVYWHGRLFVILATAIASWLLFAALREIVDWRSALAGMALFLICPATICFSQTLKPHWYALAFANLVLLVLVRGFARRKVPLWHEMGAGISLGLAVGSAMSFGSFAVFVWLALVVLVRRGALSWAALFRVPAIALAVFAATNPYVLANFLLAHGEAELVADWYKPAVNVAALGEFVWNSFLPGFGVALGVAVAFIVIREIVRPTFPGARGFAGAILVALIFVAVMAANLSLWPVNYRLISYVFPAGILLVFASLRPIRMPLLLTLVLLTAVAAAPLKLAYIDENDPTLGTRLRAAQWIDTNVPPGTGLCTDTTPAPYNTPPFDFARYRVNGGDCAIIVRVERYEVDHATPLGYTVVERFAPRFSTDRFALIFGHINPLISIYRRN